VVIDSIEDADIQILHVSHGRRDIEGQLGE
jgi:hypothetical protein